MTTKPDDTDLDRLDRRLLALWQHDTRQPARMLGEAVGLSAAAVQRRLKRLREIGVIERETAQLAPRALGSTITCIVGVDLEHERAADLARFRKRIAAEPSVQQCYYVTGTSDFMLIVLSPDMEHFEAFTRRALLSDDNVKSFTTHVVLERVKVGLAVPVVDASGAR